MYFAQRWRNMLNVHENSVNSSVQWRRQDLVPGGAQKLLCIYTRRLSTVWHYIHMLHRIRMLD